MKEMTLTSSRFFAPAKLPGSVLIIGTLLPAFVIAVVSLAGSVTSSEAMFGSVDHAVGALRSLQAMAFAWAAWCLISLAGFVMLAVQLWERNIRIIPALATVGLTVFTVVVLLESAFHLSITSWAVRQVELGREVPELFDSLRSWLNVYAQLLANPVATLSFLAVGVGLLRARMISVQGGRFIIVWSGLATLFPLPLAFAGIPFVIGALILRGHTEGVDTPRGRAT